MTLHVTFLGYTVTITHYKTLFDFSLPYSKECFPRHCLNSLDWSNKLITAFDHEMWRSTVYEKIMFARIVLVAWVLNWQLHAKLYVGLLNFVLILLIPAEKAFFPKTYKWYWYIYDAFCIWSGSDQELLVFVKYLNEMDKNTLLLAKSFHPEKRKGAFWPHSSV